MKHLMDYTYDTEMIKWAKNEQNLRFFWAVYIMILRKIHWLSCCCSFLIRLETENVKKMPFSRMGFTAQTLKTVFEQLIDLYNALYYTKIHWYWFQVKNN